MVGHLVKTLPVRFFKYGLVTELLRETCKGGLILSILAAYVPGNLNSTADYSSAQGCLLLTQKL